MLNVSEEHCDGENVNWGPWHGVACTAELQRGRDGTILSLEDWSALYDYQKEKGAGKVVYNHPRPLELLEYLKSHRRFMNWSQTNILGCRGRAWGEMDFKVINSIG